MRYGLKTKEFYDIAKIGDEFIVSDDPVSSFYYKPGTHVRYMGYTPCSCSYSGCNGKGSFMDLKTMDIKNFCMAWSSQGSSICQWTFMNPIKNSIFLPEDLFEI